MIHEGDKVQLTDGSKKIYDVMYVDGNYLTLSNKHEMLEVAEFDVEPLNC